MTLIRHTPRAARPAAGAAAVVFAGLLLSAGGAGDAAAAPAPRTAVTVLAAPAVQDEETIKYYVVGTQGNGEPDTLFSIAEKVLGDGNRFNEIFELNKGRVQSDGSVLETATRIEPGWLLQLPEDASGAGVQIGVLKTVPAPAGGSAGANEASAGSSLTLALGVGFALVVGAAGSTLALRRRFTASARAALAVTAQPADGSPLVETAAAASPFASSHRPATTTAAPASAGRRAPRSVAPRVASPTPVVEPGTEEYPESALPTPVTRTAVSIGSTALAPAPRPAGDRQGTETLRPRSAEEQPRLRPASRRGTARTVQVVFGDDLVDISLAGNSSYQDTTIAWMPVPYEVPEGGAAFVCIGSAELGCLFLDLAQAPGAIALSGDHEAARRLSESILLQLSASPVLDQACAVVTGRLADMADGLDKIEKLGSLREIVSRRQEEADPPFEFVFCAVDSEDDEKTLDDLLDGPGRSVPIVLGGADSATWRLHVQPGGAGV